MSQCRFNASIILCCDSSSHAGEDSFPVILSLFATWVSCFSMTRSSWSTDLSWIGSKGAGGILSTPRKGCEFSEHTGKSQPMVKWRREQGTASPGHKKEKEKKGLSLLFALSPFALTTSPHLHWKEGLGSRLLRVKYSYRAPSTTVLCKHQ